MEKPLRAAFPLSRLSLLRRSGFGVLFLLSIAGVLFRHLQVTLQRREGLTSPTLHVGIYGRLRFLLELGYVLLVIGDHIFHVGLVELLTAQLFQPRFGSLIFGIEIGRQGHALL